MYSLLALHYCRGYARKERDQAAAAPCPRTDDHGQHVVSGQCLVGRIGGGGQRGRHRQGEDRRRERRRRRWLWHVGEDRRRRWRRRGWRRRQRERRWRGRRSGNGDAECSLDFFAHGW